MSWLFERKLYQSEKNGLILCKKLFGHWEVFVDGFYQSAPYIKKMWRTGLRQVSSMPAVSRILVLGLGAGSIINDLHSRYPDAFITTIEYDPTMVVIARQLEMFDQKLPVNIIVADAVTAVPALEGSFDLIIVDLYKGGVTAEALQHPDFVESITQKLLPNGTLILNVFKNVELFPLFDRFLTRQNTWKYSFNALAMYKKSTPR
ncbi:MAG: methyltransferase domain-containing protein [Patescibacteria group bacterium]|jgi:spermidine synthase